MYPAVRRMGLRLTIYHTIARAAIVVQAVGDSQFPIRFWRKIDYLSDNL
jgi:hypothetical protein